METYKLSLHLVIYLIYIQGVKSLPPFAFSCPWTCKRISERRPFALIFGFAPSASETAKSTVAMSA